MKQKMLVIFFGIILGGLLFSTEASANIVQVYVDEIEVDFPDQKPFINADNRTLVPLRFVSQALGAQVIWQEKTQTVTIKLAEEIMILTIGEKTVHKGDETIMLDTTAVISQGRTIVPLRFISECLGAHVYWNGNKRKVFITTKLPPVNEFVGVQFKPEDLPFKGGGRPLERSDRPSARIQYVKLTELPVKLKDGRIIYDLTVDEQYVFIKQYSKDKSPIALYMVENEELNRNRCYYSDVQESTIFTFKYPVQSRLEQALGEKPVDLSKVEGFTVHTLSEGNFRMLVIENPLYQGGNL